MSFQSKILISSDFEGIKERMQDEFKDSILKFIPKDFDKDFLIDDAREVQKESFLAENKEKIIIIMSKSFKTEAQNFLLKLFEEPPRNIKFLLVCPSKNLLLATIRSRFIIEKEKRKKEPLPDLSLKNFDLKSFFDFLQKNENIDKEELIRLIKAFSLAACKERNLNDEELEYFYKFYELARLNSRASLIISAMFLLLQERK